MDTTIYRRFPTYTDGSRVREGDMIRYHQVPGGLLPASGKWTYGVAAVFPRTDEERARMDAYNKKQGYVALDPDELCLKTEVPSGYGTRTAYYNIFSHVIERVHEDA